MGNIGICGAGLIGASWAVGFANAGHKSLVYDNNKDSFKKFELVCDQLLKDLTIINPELVTQDMSDAIKNLMCDDKDGIKRGTPHNRSALNLLNSHKPTIVPSVFVIPAKSNLFVYGPWFYQANPVGGTIVEKNKCHEPYRIGSINYNRRL